MSRLLLSERGSQTPVSELAMRVVRELGARVCPIDPYALVLMADSLALSPCVGRDLGLSGGESAGLPSLVIA